MNSSKFNEINQSFNQLDPNSSLGLKLDYTDLLQTLSTSLQKSPNSGLADGNPENKERENELAATPSSSAQAQKPLMTTKIRENNKASASSDHLKNASGCFFHGSLNELDRRILVRKQGIKSASSNRIKISTDCFFHWDINENEDAQRGWVGEKLLIGDKIIPSEKIRKTKHNVESDSETENTKKLSL